MQAYFLVVRVLLTPPAEAAASQKWKIIYLQVLRFDINILSRNSIAGFFNPSSQKLAMRIQDIFIVLDLSEVLHFTWVVFQVYELFAVFT